MQIWVSEVLQVRLPQAGFVSVDTDIVTQSRTTHSREGYSQVFHLQVYS